MTCVFYLLTFSEKILLKKVFSRVVLKEISERTETKKVLHDFDHLKKDIKLHELDLPDFNDMDLPVLDPDTMTYKERDGGNDGSIENV